ncbi:hypothetical protein [Deinococcus sp. QL22]|uniref:hypothetical protein n=1 Tax=Deinococcus sp. QL22 TaxID=2939437 RepID=UPI002017AF6D|nr:hypothetical protein [Deinococcus sp. QL22]UQN05433.1 hypothetical protein M1R55_11165 [Deinococcus sp. QL22]
MDPSPKQQPAVELQDWDDVNDMDTRSIQSPAEPVSPELALTRQRLEHSVPEESTPLPKSLSSPVAWWVFWGVLALIGLLVAGLTLLAVL